MDTERKGKGGKDSVTGGAVGGGGFVSRGDLSGEVIVVGMNMEGRNAASKDALLPGTPVRVAL